MCVYPGLLPGLRQGLLPPPLPSPAPQTRLASGKSLVSPFYLSVGGLGLQLLGGSELRSSGLALYPLSHLFSPLKHSNKRFKSHLLQI